MSSFQERVSKFLDMGMSEGLLTFDDYNALMVALEEAGKITTIHPELYAGLLKDSLESFSEMTKEAQKEVSKLKKALKDKRLKIKDVVKDEEMWPLNALGADASSCPVPMGLAKAAFISAMASREETQPVIIRDLIRVENDAIASREFKFYY